MTNPEEIREPDLWRTTSPTARKAHTCDECGSEIAKGDTYTNCVVIYPDGLEVYKSHTPLDICFENK